MLTPLKGIRPENLAQAPLHRVHAEHLAQLRTLLICYGAQRTLRALAAICDDHMIQASAYNVGDAKRWLRISTELEAIADNIESENL